MSVPDGQLVDDVVAAVRRRWAEGLTAYPYELLADRYDTEVVLDMMDQLDDAGILESGVSLRTAWVREYDEELEQRIDAFKRGEEYPTPVG